MKNLLIVNFTMDSTNSVLSHQVVAVEKLAPDFHQVIVLTADAGSYVAHKNIRVVSTSWENGKPLKNVFSLYREFFKVIKSNSIDVVFSHMTDLQTALLVPLTRIMGIKHFLWYAHKHQSRYLYFSSFFLNGIITSTPGSCPIKGPKVSPIGQGVDVGFFPFKTHDLHGDLKCIHVGRFDYSKKIESLIDTGIELRELNFPLSLTLIGDPSNTKARKYQQSVIDAYQFCQSSGWLHFSPAVNRNDLPNLLENFDVFIHAYMGSLDKTLIEATLSGLPVVTTNPEYIENFGSWTGSDRASLKEEFLALLTYTRDELAIELKRRRDFAANHHSLENWAKQVNQLLNE